MWPQVSKHMVSLSGPRLLYMKTSGFGLWPPLESPLRLLLLVEIEQEVLAHSAMAPLPEIVLSQHVNIVVATFLQAIFTNGHIQWPESETKFNLNLADDKPTLNLSDGESTLNILVEMNLLWTFVEVWGTESEQSAGWYSASTLYYKLTHSCVIQFLHSRQRCLELKTESTLNLWCWHSWHCS